MTKPDRHGEGEHTFNGSPIKVGHRCLADPELLELPQEIESLVGFANHQAGIEIQLDVCLR